MTGCQVGPKYCPECGLELESNASVCIFCRNRLEQEKVKRIKFVKLKDESVRRKSIFFFKNGKDYPKKKNKKLPIIIGALISTIDITYIIIVSIISRDPSAYLQLPTYTIELVSLALITNPIGLGLIFFSLNSKFKGLFLIIVGYLTFGVSFLLPIYIPYYIRDNILRYIFLIDIPIVVVILFGVIIINLKQNNNSFNALSFIIVLFSNTGILCSLGIA